MQGISQGTGIGSCRLVDYSSSDADSYVSPSVLECDVRSLVNPIIETRQVARTHRDVYDFSDCEFSDPGNESDGVENVSEAPSLSGDEQQGQDETA